MMILKYTSLIILLFISQISYSQNITHGIVIDIETAEPIVGAIVSDAKSGKVFTVTDASGKFTG